MSVHPRPRLLVDVTQYVGQPATAGIQRVLWRLARDWPGHSLDARYGFLRRGSFVSGPLSALGSVIGEQFQSPNIGLSMPSDVARKPLRAAASERVRVRDIEEAFDAYLLPEPTFHPSSAAVATRLRSSVRTPAFFIYYDALPLTHPELFPKRTAEGLEPFSRAVVSSDNVAFISKATQRVVEGRLARRPLANALVAALGADSLPTVPSRAPDTPTFTVLGTVEPRKRHRLVFDAFEGLWDAGFEYRLVVAGAPGWERFGEISRLRRLHETGRATWIESPRDDDLARAVAGSSAVLYVPEDEGYGLPPVEALAAGCPVILPADLPSLEDLPDLGQIRLESVTAGTIATAVETLASPAANAQHRRAIESLELPTWAQFADRLERWITRSLASDRRSLGRVPRS